MNEHTPTNTRVWRTGRGPKLVLLHGEFGNAGTYWNPIVESVARHFDVIMPDLPGFGESAPQSDFRLQTYLVWLKQLTDALGGEPEADGSPIVLVGSGFGATLARLFAARYQRRVKRLVLSGGGDLQRSSPLRGLLARLGRRSGKATLPGNPRSARDLFDDPDRYCDSEFLRSFEQARGAAARVLRARDEAPLPPDLTPVCPTLLLWGNEDRYRPLAAQQVIAAELTDPRRVEIYEAGHLVMIEQPHRFSAHLLDFVGT